MSTTASRAGSTSPSRGRTSRNTESPAGKHSSPSSRKSSGRKSSGRKSPGKQSPGPRSAKSSRSATSSKSPQSRSGRSRSGGRSKSPSKSRLSNSSKSDGALGAAAGKASTITSRRVKLRTAELEERGFRSLDMSGQGMTTLGGSLFLRKDLGDLDLSSNNLRVIPGEIRKLQTLVHLDLSRNGIRCTHPQDFNGLPTELGSLPSLEVLLISECNLPFIPPAIWRCSHLKVLDISRNKINVLPPEIGNLEQLQHLNAQQTSIMTLPPEIALCQQIEEIMLWGNVIESLPETLKELPKLTTLAINFRSFCSFLDEYRSGMLKKGQIQSEHIPPVLFEMPVIDSLDLNETKLNCLPEQCVGQLKEFFLAQNYFQKMPNMILNMSSLETLDLSDNMITQIPPEIGKLVNLRVFKMCNNQATSIPMNIGKLKKLSILILSGNQFTLIPDAIGELSNLKTLVVDRNNLHSIPETITDLEHLETLDLTDNKISTLPIKFHKMQSITSAHTYQKFHKYGLWLHNNPLTTPPQEVWKTDNPQWIFEYLKRLQIQRTQNLQKQKLFLIGDSQCGKTSLVNAITTGKSSLTNRLEDSTTLIDYFAWKTDNGVDFLIHDFGGNDIYKTTHHLFLDAKGIYLLIYDHSKYSSEKFQELLGCWLDLLQLYVPGAVVRIIGTHKDLVQTTEDEVPETTKDTVEADLNNYVTGQQRRLESTKSAIDKAMTEAETRQELEHLKQQKFRLVALKKQALKLETSVTLVSSAEGIEGIQSLVSDLELLAVDKDLFPHAQKFIPDHWFSFRLTLKSIKDHCLSLTRIKHMAKEHKFPKAEISDCLSFLADCGEILWYQNIPAISKYIFQRPCHLVDILRGIFRHDIDSFMDYEINRVFACKGYMNREIFDKSKYQFTECGQICRPMLRCLWFYLLLSNDNLDILLDLIPSLDLCYAVPQPILPRSRMEYTPLMVVPEFCMEARPDDVEVQFFWPYPLPPGQCELTITTTFPQAYPRGLFEKLLCRIHEEAETRTDWKDLVLLEMDIGAVLIERSQKQGQAKELNCVIDVKTRGADLNSTKSILKVMAIHLFSLLTQYSGAIWCCKLKQANCDNIEPTEWFPDVLIN